MKKRKLTRAQEFLLNQLGEYISKDHSLPYDSLKAYCGGSFDGTFNALLEKGYVERVKTDDFSNQFKLTK